MGTDFLAQFYFPGATQVTLQSDFGEFELHSDDGENWSASLIIPPGPHLYRFTVDRFHHFPDPFNCQYHLMDTGYFSVWDATVGRINDFPEEPQSLFLTDTIPQPTTLYGLKQVREFGPLPSEVVAILTFEGIQRPDNHLVWVWQSPSGRQHLFAGEMIRPGCDYTFGAVPYELFAAEQGTWLLSCFLNGRTCGTICCVIRALGYPSQIMNAISRNHFQRLQR
ncbi:MAG TPA: hypothetical protein VGK74_07280 [Symbiobacteriaceae bacterium]|jgi:hypothetical protein